MSRSMSKSSGEVEQCVNNPPDSLKQTSIHRTLVIAGFTALETSTDQPRYLER